MEETKKENTDSDINLPKFGQDEVDAIEDLHSPPNSPGLVLPGKVQSSNDRIDFFALDSVCNSGENVREEGDPVQDAGKETLLRSPPSLSTGAAMNKQRRMLKPAVPLISKSEDLDLNLYTSSDSYFSRARKGGPVLTISKQANNKLKSRRASDASDRSEGCRSYASGSSFEMGETGLDYFTESDTDLGSSPTARYGKRKLSGRVHNGDASGTYSVGRGYHQHDDGVVFRTTSSAASSDLGSEPRRTRGRSRSRSRSVSRSREKGGDLSTTSQIFKNMLILEEGLRQQYIHQQSLRYKYTMILLAGLLVFAYSTYISAITSISVAVNNTVNTNLDDAAVYGSAVGTTTCDHRLKNGGYRDTSLATGEFRLSDHLYCLDIPEFPTMHDDFRRDGASNAETAQREAAEGAKPGPDGRENGLPQKLDAEECKYILANIIYRAVAIITGMTLVLFFLTGEYTRTISRPRKFLATSNKGIRQLNVRLVKVKAPLLDQLQEYFRFRMTKCHHGVDHIRLVLNPRVFSTAIREQWELYRNQFWNLEDVRRQGQQKIKDS